MSIANLGQFSGGLVNKAGPHLLADDQAVVCENCVIDTGVIVPLAGTLAVLSTDTTNLSIYKFGDAWETHTAERWYAEEGSRLYWADGGIPQKKHATLGQARLGIVAPATAPAAGSLTTTGTAGIVLPEGGASYVVTHFSDPLLAGGWGGESAPSDEVRIDEAANLYFVLTNDPDGSLPLLPSGGFPTTLYAVHSGATFPASGTLSVDGELMTYSSRAEGLTDVQFTISGRGVNGTTFAQHFQGAAGHIAYSAIGLTGIPVSADPQVNARRIWRMLAREYRLVGQINDNTTTTYSDTMSDAVLSGATILTTDDNDTPPALDWICGPYNGMLFGGVGNTLRWTKIAKYDAWPEEYAFDFQEDLTIGVVFGGAVIVLCSDGLHSVSGSDPAYLSRTKTLTKQGCLHGRTAVDAGRALLYLSPDGVCAFDGAYSVVASDAALTKATFGLTDPKAAFHDGHYHLFHSTGCIIGDFRGDAPIWRTATVTAASVFRSDADDALYLGKPGAIHEWGAGTPMAWRYWTGELSFGTLAATKIFHTLVCHYENDVRCELYVDGKQRHDKTVQGERRAYRMRLTGAARGYRPQLRMSGPAAAPGTVYAIEFEYSGPGRAR